MDRTDNSNLLDRLIAIETENAKLKADIQTISTNNNILASRQAALLAKQKHDDQHRINQAHQQNQKMKNEQRNARR